MRPSTSAGRSELSDEQHDEHDGLERLWAPHRLAYVQKAEKGACVFCAIPSMADEDGLVVARGGAAYVVLNLYPYNPGHLMVVPYRHVAHYEDLEPAEAVEVAQLTQHALRAVRHASAPDGFNLGMNQGRVAGAGIADHLHQHVVPRWSGDGSFMTIIGSTKVLPQTLPETRALLARAWHEVA